MDVEYEQMAETLGDHVIVWKKGDPPLPAKDYNEMRLVVATYCALLFVLYTALLSKRGGQDTKQNAPGDGMGRVG